MKNKKTQVLIYIENGLIWKRVKVCDHQEVEVIVVNNDNSTVWKPEVEYNCDAEIQQSAELAEELEKNVGNVSKRFKND